MHHQTGPELGPEDPPLNCHTTRNLHRLRQVPKLAGNHQIKLRQVKAKWQSQSIRREKQVRQDLKLSGNLKHVGAESIGD